MSEGNGIIRVGGRSVRKFALRDDPPFEADVVELYNQYTVLRSSYADEKGEVPAARLGDLNVGVRAWLQDQLTGVPEGHPYHGVGLPDLSPGESLAFVKLLIDEVEELSVFFRPKSARKPSSPESTELRFST